MRPSGLSKPIREQDGLRPFLKALMDRALRNCLKAKFKIGGYKMGCGKCHACGSSLRIVLDGEDWCPKCQDYRRYTSHGWGRKDKGLGIEESPCPKENDSL